MRILRTPDFRFANLLDYAFEPHYVELPAAGEGKLRVHYLDEGPRDGHPLVLLHGQPSWSYLYREMIPGFAEAGLRVLAPDLVGFGRSDKPAEPSDYSYERHVGWINDWLVTINPNPSTLFVHDWGGFIGLRVLARRPERFERAIVSNSGLPDGERIEPLEIFYTWRQFVRDQEQLAIGNVIQLGSTKELSDEVVFAYEAPFPDESYKSGVRAFPELVPTEAEDQQAAANRKAWQVLEDWTKPFLTLFGELDPMNAGSDQIFQERVPGAKDQPHARLAGAGHYIQEDAAGELTERVIDFVRSTSRE
jgi:haloalkane dehalogenase